MKNKFALSVVGLLIGLTQVPRVYADLPAQEIWGPLSDLWVMIWPEYAGVTGEFIDALLLFFLVTMTVVETAKKTGKVPSKAAWAVGIGLWISVVVALQASGRLIFTSPWFVFIGFLIITMQLAFILKSLFERMFGQQAKVMQWIVSLCIAIPALGGIFSSILQNLEVLSPTEEFIVNLMLASIALATPILIISLTILVIKAWNLKGASGRRDAVDKTRKYMANSLKQERKDHQKKQQEQEAVELLRKLESNTEELEKKILDLDYEVGEDLTRIKTIANTLREHANSMQSHVQEYSNYVKNNRGKTKKTYLWGKDKAKAASDYVFDDKNTSGDHKTAYADLPKEYKAQLDNIVDSYQRQLDALIEAIQELEHKEIEEQQITKNLHVKELEDKSEFFEGKVNDLIAEIETADGQVSYVEKQMSRVAQKSETQDNGGLHKALYENMAYKRLATNLGERLKKVQEVKTKVEEEKKPLKKNIEFLGNYFEYTESYLKQQTKDLKRGLEALKKLPELAKDTKTHLLKGIQILDPELFAKGTSSLVKISKEITVEENKAQARAEREQQIKQYFGKIDELIEKTQGLYQEAEEGLDEELLKTVELASITEAVADLEEEIEIIDTMLVREAQQVENKEEQDELHRKVIKQAESAPKRLRNEVAQLLNELRKSEDKTRAKKFQQEIVGPIQQLSQQLKEKAERLAENNG